LLIGEEISVRAVSIREDVPYEPHPMNKLSLLYEQIGKHDCNDIPKHKMLLPYEIIKDEFPEVVNQWLSKSKQAELATNIFCWSSKMNFHSLDTMFMMSAQIAESYHRSLSTGIYMDQDEYEQNILPRLLANIPSELDDDQKMSLKNRLKYGNELSLRKRLQQLFNRIPENVQKCIAGDIRQFISKSVDTRNYFTHYDHDSQQKAFENKYVLIAAERMRILVVANLLQDLGIGNDKMLHILRRNADFLYCMEQELKY
jgi:hypothetical protein